MARLHCPHCGQLLDIADKHLGRKITCGACSKPFPAAVATEALETFPVHCPACGHTHRVSGSILGRHISCPECKELFEASADPFEEASVKRSRKCQYCAETIQAAAIKCRYCGSDLDAPRSGPDPKRRAGTDNHATLTKTLGVLSVTMGLLIPLISLGLGSTPLAIATSCLGAMHSRPRDSASHC